MERAAEGDERMIKHLGESLTPFEASGFARSPEQPLCGEDVTVHCRLDRSDATPTLRMETASGAADLFGRQTGVDGERRWFSFSLGSFDRPQAVSYQIEAGGERTPRFSFEVLTQERLTAREAAHETPDGLSLRLADDLRLTFACDGSFRLEQAACASGVPASGVCASGAPSSDACASGASSSSAPTSDATASGASVSDVPASDACASAAPRRARLLLAEDRTLETGADFICQLKRLSEPLLTLTACVVRRNVQGTVRRVRLEGAMSARHVMGTGERFDSVDQYGRSADGCVTEKFTHQGGETYLPVPFFFTEAGWGCCWETSLPVALRFGAECAFEQETESPCLMSARLLFGTPAELLAQYSGLTGKPVLPPEWAFGVWISGNGWNSDDEVDAQLAALKRYQYPASVMVLEQWSDEQTFYRWHPSHWRDPAALVRRIRESGLHLLLWQIPVIKHEWDGAPCEELRQDEREAVERGYAVLSEDGSPYRITENWFHHSLLPDFTNPEAVRWWFAKREPLLAMGVEGFKTDGGEFLFEKNARLFSGMSGRAAHNLYPSQYVGAYQAFLREHGVNGVTFSRAGYAGAQTQPIHWSGDQKSEWGELQAQLCAGLSAGLSGLIFWSFDIGGFAGPLPEPELYLRATAMGCFAPVMQWHSEPRGGQYGGERVANNDRSPWNLAEQYGDERLLTIGCRFARLRESLRPYLWREAQECVRAARPMMAHLCVDFPDDARVWSISDEYLLGRELLVAPITQPHTERRGVYLPRGVWSDFFTGERQIGPCEITVDCPLDSISVWRRETGA